MKKTWEIKEQEIRQEIAKYIEGYLTNPIDEHCKDILKICAKFARGQSS